MLDDGVLKYDGADEYVDVFDIPALERRQPLSRGEYHIVYMLFSDDEHATIVMDREETDEDGIIWEGSVEDAVRWIREATGGIETGTPRQP